MAMLGLCAGFVGQGAADVFELNGGVVNRETIAKDRINAAQDGIAGRGRHVLNKDMAAQRMRFRPEAPDVEIVNVDHAGNTTELMHNVSELQSFG